MKTIEEVLKIATTLVNKKYLDSDVSQDSLNKILDVLKKFPLDDASHNKKRLSNISSLIEEDLGINE